jgi:outer membrane protein assembly factor BamE (lipoprotein component of BamABCDE complex)
MNCAPAPRGLISAIGFLPGNITVVKAGYPQTADTPESPFKQGDFLRTVSVIKAKAPDMKRMQITMTALIAVSGLALVSGCSSTSSSSASSASTTSITHSDDDFRPPSKGEKKAQVKAQFDDPQQMMQTSEGGESWVYVLGQGKLFIPFYGPFAEVRVLTVHFDKNGRVSS